MKTPLIIHPKPPKGWKVTTRRGDDPHDEVYFAFVWNPVGQCIDVCLNDEHGTEYCARTEAKRAGIQRAHELANPKTKK